MSGSDVGAHLATTRNRSIDPAEAERAVLYVARRATDRDDAEHLWDVLGLAELAQEMTVQPEEVR